MSELQPYELRASASTARIIQLKLPTTVAAAVIEFSTGSLLYEIGRHPRQRRPFARVANADGTRVANAHGT